MRGEYYRTLIGFLFVMELPPRARRILLTAELVDQYQGTTSACAENTKKTGQKFRLAWNYLRVRGEYSL